MSASPSHFLGVDGGATRCRARLRGRDGALVGEAEGAAANVYVDFDAAMAVVAGVIEEALRRAGLGERREAVALGVGLAGLSTRQEAARVEARLAGFASVTADNDAVIACLGAHGGADGAIVIAGTGSAAMARVAGRNTIVGGRGFIVGDDGSGARIGVDALRAAVKAADGLGPASALTSALLARFGADDPDAAALGAVEWAATARPGDFGALAPIVLDHAHRGDAIALIVVAGAVAAIDALTQAVRALGASRVALVGGLGKGLRPFLGAPLGEILAEPRFDAVEGAILLAGGPRPSGPGGGSSP